MWWLCRCPLRPAFILTPFCFHLPMGAVITSGTLGTPEAPLTFCPFLPHITSVKGVVQGIRAPQSNRYLRLLHRQSSVAWLLHEVRRSRPRTLVCTVRPPQPSLLHRAQAARVSKHLLGVSAHRHVDRLAAHHGRRVATYCTSGLSRFKLLPSGRESAALPCLFHCQRTATLLGMLLLVLHELGRLANLVGLL